MFQETFEDDFAVGGVISFGIYLSELDTMHEGRICRMLSTDGNPESYVYLLYVDGCLIPEHLSSGVSAIMTSGYSQNTVGACASQSHAAQDELPPSYDDVVGLHDDGLPVIFDSMKLKKDN
jgi:hypothetical protein